MPLSVPQVGRSTPVPPRPASAPRIDIYNGPLRRTVGCFMLASVSAAYRLGTAMKAPATPDLAHTADPKVVKPMTPQRDHLFRQVVLKAYPVARYLVNLPLTPRDCPAISQERTRQLEILRDRAMSGEPMESLSINTPERQKLRDELVQNLRGSGARCKDRVAYFIIGLPAAGKSTISDPLAEKAGALVVDGDDIREALPDWRAGHPMTYVDSEKQMLRQRLIDVAVHDGDNLILSAVPAGTAGVARTLKQLKENHYEVHLISLHLGVDQALDRMMHRFSETGRYVEPISEYLSRNAVDTVYQALKKSDLVDAYQMYSTDVAVGQAPVLLEEGRNT